MVPMEEYRVTDAQRSWAHWYQEDADHMAHPYDGELETYLAAQGVPYDVRKAQGSGWTARKHQLEALERWYDHGWSRLDAQAAIVHHRRHCRVPVAVRRQPRGASRILPTAQRLHGHAAGGSPASSRTDRHVCSTPAG